MDLDSRRRPSCVPVMILVEDETERQSDNKDLVW